MDGQDPRVLSLLKHEPSEPGTSPVHAPADERERGEDERPIRCRACGRVVTTQGAKISVHGAHEHRRVNPSGVGFHLGCFADAPGCLAEGTPTTFWTWFPGYAWQIASCRGCGDHLGWAFQGERAFFALILPHLVEE